MPDPEDREKESDGAGAPGANPSALLAEDLESQRPSTTTTNSRGRSTAYLDGLRGLAALLVFMQHYTPRFYGGAEDFSHGFGENGHYYVPSFPFIRLLFTGGNAAVHVFFILSGYVLSQSHLRTIRGGGTCDAALVSAVVRRPIRLHLPTLATTLVFAVLLHAPFGEIRKMGWPGPRPTLGAELAEWAASFVHYFNPFASHKRDEEWFRYGIVVWTLWIELNGSWLVYFVLFVLSRTARIATTNINFIGVSVFMVLLFSFVYWHMALFMAGVGLSMVDVYELRFPQPMSDKSKSIMYHSLLVVGLYLVTQPATLGGPGWAQDTPGWGFLTSITPGIYYEEQYWRFWATFGAVFIVTACRRLQWLQDSFVTRPLRYLGQVSFALYLTHPMVIYTFSERIHRTLGQLDAVENEEESWLDGKLWIPDWGPTGFSTRFLFALAIMLSLSLGFAHLGTIYLDRPSIRAGRAVVARLGLK